MPMLLCFDNNLAKRDNQDHLVEIVTPVDGNFVLCMSDVDVFLYAALCMCVFRCL